MSKLHTRHRVPSLAVLCLMSIFILVSCGESKLETGGEGSGHSGAGHEHLEGGAEAESPKNHEHEVAGETCFICDASKREAGRLWCDEHTRYEDRCWICHPDLEEKGRMFCDEHGVYEDECDIYHPDLGESGEKEEQSSEWEMPDKKENELFCNEHHVPEIQCGICQPQLALELKPGGQLQVRFESKESAGKAGIRTVPAREIEAQSGIAAVCEVRYNQNELARITPLAAGILRHVLVDVGAEVEAGDLLAELHSVEAASAKSSYVSAVVDLELKAAALGRVQRLMEKKISSEAEYQEAYAAHRTAQLALATTQQRLLNYGFTTEEVEAIGRDLDTTASLFLRAPYRGTIVGRDAVVGVAVKPGDRLLELANLDLMWLELSIPADQAPYLTVGQRVAARFGADSMLDTEGVLTWVNTGIDERTRMLGARAVVDNGERRLRAGLFGDARILLGEPGAAVAVPSGAIQRYERNPFVFIKLEDDLYSMRRVELVQGSPVSDYVSVLDGLAAGEPVVTEGAFTVMSEFLKSRLGAGCVDD